MTNANSHRELLDHEKRVLLRLMGPVFPGRDELLRQLGGTLALPLDENGSLDLRCELATPAPVVRRVPTEGSAVDRDGVAIHYLLHVVDGMLRELEVYKDDSSKVLEHPDPKAIEVMILG